LNVLKSSKNITIATTHASFARGRSPAEAWGATVASMLWSVRNSIGATGLPIDDWAGAAAALLRDDPSVRSAIVLATDQEDEVALDGSRLAGLSVDVLIVATDAVTAAATVEQALVGTLFELVGDREVGWTSYDWAAVPAPG
jgi:hypothetical protein